MHQNSLFSDKLHYTAGPFVLTSFYFFLPIGSEKELAGKNTQLYYTTFC